MPLRRLLAVLGLCLLCAPLAAQTCDQAPLPPVYPRNDPAYQSRVRKAVDEVSKLQTPYQAVPMPNFPTEVDPHDAAVAEWNQSLEEFKAKNYYKQTEDLDAHRHVGKIPCYHDVACDENVVIVSPDGHRVTLTAGEFHYFIVHQSITMENLAAIENLFKPLELAQAQAKLKPAKVSRFQGWFHKAVKDMDQQASGPSGASR